MPEASRQETFTEAIRIGMEKSMHHDDSVICFGIGVTDPKGVFGTTTGLETIFGSERVFDMPTSENAMTGVAVGAALGGLRPVMVHQRFDFFLLAMDQLVNSAAKWRFMFGGAFQIPLTIRLVIGQGWGQGPTHSQNFQSWLTHIPGLKVVAPSTPDDAYHMLLASIQDNNPVIYLEHRWLHNQIGEISNGHSPSLGKARVVRKGEDITIVCWSNMVVEAIRAAEILEENEVSCELVDIRTLRPMDWSAIEKSVKKTGRLLVLDNGHEMNGYGAEVVARAASSIFSDLKAAPERVGMPNYPSPTSFGMTRDHYPDSKRIVQKVMALCGCREQISGEKYEYMPHDVPGSWFRGPF
jgi:pyruvate dehydrogenase E1 component beta subunit